LLLEGVQLCVLGRRGVAEALVQAGGVVPADVLDDGELELAARPPDAVGDQLGLEAVEEALGKRVVVGVADGADRGEHAMVGERLCVIDARVLRAAVGVPDCRRAASGSGFVVRPGFPRRFAPWIPAVRISRCTWQRGARSPARRSAFHIA
jgi:hypothetical protein